MIAMRCWKLRWDFKATSSHVNSHVRDPSRAHSLQWGYIMRLRATRLSKFQRLIETVSTDFNDRNDRNDNWSLSSWLFFFHLWPASFLKFCPLRATDSQADFEKYEFLMIEDRRSFAHSSLSAKELMKCYIHQAFKSHKSIMSSTSQEARHVNSIKTLLIFHSSIQIVISVKLETWIQFLEWWRRRSSYDDENIAKDTSRVLRESLQCFDVTDSQSIHRASKSRIGSATQIRTNFRDDCECEESKTQVFWEGLQL